MALAFTVPGEVVRPDVEEGGARSRGGLEVDAEVAPLPTRRDVDRRLHLSQTWERTSYCGIVLRRIKLSFAPYSTLKDNWYSGTD